MIIAVAGPPGAGKTTWIRHKLAVASSRVLYVSPGTLRVPIDTTCIAAEFPSVRTLQAGQEVVLQKVVVVW